jgi:tetratricopeptide (TPR) repeat protein
MRPTAGKHNPSQAAQLGLELVAAAPVVAAAVALDETDAERVKRVRTAVDEIQAGNLEAAAAILDPLLAAEPEDFDTLHAGAVLRLKLGRFAEALALMQKAVTKNPPISRAPSPSTRATSPPRPISGSSIRAAARSRRRSAAIARPSPPIPPPPRAIAGLPRP